MTSTTTDVIDGVSGSTAIKAPVRVATTANITLSGTQTIDGVAVVADERVLVKNQTTATENGIYNVSGTAWSRAADFDGNRDVKKGTLVTVHSGTVNENTVWRCTTADPVVIGTSSITFEDALINDSDVIVFTQAGSGAVDRTVQEKLRDTVSVKDFGVVGDGETDDTTNFQAAVAAAAGVSNLYVPAGTYMIEAETSITLPSNTTLILDDNAEIKAIQNDSNSYAIFKIGTDAASAGQAQTTTNVRIYGGKITGERDTHIGATGEAGHCIYIRNCSNVYIDHVTITKGWGDGIYLGNSQGVYRGQDTSPRNVHIDECIVTDNSRNNISIACGEGIYINGCEAARADRTNPKAGIDVECDETGLLVKNVRISGNNIHDNDGNGIDVNDSGDGDTENVTITENSIYLNGTGGILTRATAATKSVSITNNDIVGNTGNQVEVAGDLSGHLEGNIKIHGNLIASGVDSGTKGSGISVYGTNVWLISIQDNFVFYNPRHGIHINGTSVVDEIIIANNVVNGNSQLTNATYNNIYVQGSAHFVNIHGNLVRDDVFGELTNGAAYGIQVADNNQTYIHGNDVTEGGKTANILVANLKTAIGSGNHYVWDNAGYRTETLLRSDTFVVGSTGANTLTLAHGLPITPALSHCHVSLIAESVTDDTFDVFAWVSAVDATNVTVKASVNTASGTGADTMRAVVRINQMRPA